jgi:hypothetical protein
MAHANGLRLAANELLEASKQMPDGSEKFEVDPKIVQGKDLLMLHGQRARLNCFAEVTSGKLGYKRYDSYTSTECHSNVSHQGDEYGNRDYEAMLNDSF